MIAVLAHAGHWYTELLYMSPVAVVGLWLLAGNLRQKRLAARAGEPPRAAGDRTT